MRFVLLVVCLCAAAALATKVKKDEGLKAAVKTDVEKDVEKTVEKTVEKAVEKTARAIDSAATKEELVKNVDGEKKKNNEDQEDEEVVKLPGSDKTWGESVNSLTPSAELFAANLPMYTKAKIKPEIAQAFNLEEELAHWSKEGNPNHLTFIGDEGEPAYGVMSSNQPVFLSSYAEDVRFHLYTKYNESDVKGFRVRDFKTIEEGGFDPKLPVKVIIHGFTNTIRSPVIQLLKNAFLATGKYNVIGVDWGALCRGPWYPGARAHVSGAGAKVGEFLDALIDLQLVEPSQVHLIGHSLGAHVAGIASKSMTKGKIARITGMDPAGPLFQLTNNNGILVRDDAELVDIIHTNAGYLGKSKHLGHVDFYPNGGHFQPGCTLDISGSCSHGRSYELYASTIRNKDVVLEAYECPALPSGAGECEVRIRSGDKGERAEMGYYVKYTKEGAYYLKTSDKPDFKYILPL